MRKLASIIASAGVLVSLSACAATPSTFADCGPSGNAALVTAEGAFGSDPAADFPTPLVATTSETAQIRPGDGEAVPAGGIVDATVSLYFGDSGAPVESSNGPLTALGLIGGTRGFVYPFTEALACAEVGARVVTTGTAVALFGPDALGLDPELTLVVVSDINGAYLGRANGADQIAQSGMPAIVYAPSGQPGFTFPETTAPSEFRADLLKRGSGTETAEGDSVVVHYSSIGWGAAAVTGSTWETGVPGILVLDGAADAATSIPAEVKDALVGLPVGSQLLAVLPGEPATVYVVDVLGIAE